ncbi:MAG: helix-hairpin-helix domain-containing protein, partial [Thermoguttaceae bacterium]
YRPGPLEGGMVDDYIEVKHGRKQAAYLHPVMKEILGETNGVMVYQEQVMRILNRLGGIELANAYKCIKAISKKKLPIIAKNREKFLDGAQQQGVARTDAEELWQMIEKFAGYGFNKSHSTAYALIAYMTAYLKTHYPVEFMAGLLSGDMANRNFTRKDSTVEHLEDCERMGVEVVPPSVNTSSRDYTVKDGKIYFSLAAIKGCGGPAADAIVEARKKGPYTSLFDFCKRVDPQAVNRATVETLIKAGAFDCLGARRAQLAAVTERAIQAGASAASDRRHGQLGLFDAAPAQEQDDIAAAALPDIPEWDDRDKVAKEKEVLGFYLTSHPLAEYEQMLTTYCSHTSVEAARLSHRTEVMLGGMISAIKFSHTKNPKPGKPSRYAMWDLEDKDGIMRCILWPEQFAQYGELVQPDAILVVLGAIDKRPGSEEANLIVNELIPLDELQTRYTRGVKLRFSETEHGTEKLDLLYEIVRGYPGTGELQLVMYLADGTRVPMVCRGTKVENNQEMRSRVEELLGPGNFKLLAAPIRRNGNGHGGNGHGANGSGRNRG